MIHGVPDDVPLVDRLIARWEVSRLATVPFSLSILSIWPLFLLVWGFQAVSGIRSVVLVIVVATGWCMLAGLDVGRNVWTMRHPYASPRWLRSVHAAVGDDLAVRALAYLIRRYDHELDYVVKRSDMMTAVQIERNERHEALRRAEGFRLVDASDPTEPDPKALADAERCRRARERRAARATGRVL
jgi:hypothetical protein